MNDVTASIYCPNPQCQFPNGETNRFCQQCRSPLPRRYLWVVGDRSTVKGPLVNDRYWVKSPRVWLDTKPGVYPEFHASVPDWVVPYLRLFPNRLHIPQPFTSLGSGLLLLEDGPLHREPIGSDLDEDWLYPSLGSLWPTATPLQQLHFLWQIAHLWQPLQREGATITLLIPDLLRLEGSLVRILELQFDRSWPTPPDLVALGKGWLSLAHNAHSSLQPFLEELCQSLIQRRIRTVDPLILALEKGLEQVGQSVSRQIRISTITDQGPSRKRNEDACYPPSDTQQSFTSNAQGGFDSMPLTLVCDGIGGHEGGNIASQLAIDAVQREVQTLPTSGTELLDTVIVALERSIAVANNQISQRNDQEKRHDRQRMGTTIVLALARAHLLYVAHVGDSRVYRVTRSGCHQVTLDDDLASREVRLGYAFYRDAQQGSTSGSLVQALGMGSAINLHPTVQSFVLDEECVFLLCSDGLSDYDRVEDWWEATLLPLLDGQVDITTATRRWVEIANTLNGHDNVTVSLLHCRVASSLTSQPVQANLTLDLASSPASSEPETTQPSSAIPPQRVTQTIPTSPPNRFLPLLLLIALGSAGFLAYRLWSTSQGSPIGEVVPQPSLPQETLPPSPPSPPSPPPPPPPLTVGSLIQVVALPEGTPDRPTPPLVLLPRPRTPSTPAPQGIPIAPGSVLKILKRQELAPQNYWLQLQICQGQGAVKADPNATNPSANGARVIGWISERTIAAVAVQPNLNSTELASCNEPLPPSPSPTLKR